MRYYAEIFCVFSVQADNTDMKLDGLADRKENWSGIDAIGTVFRHKQTTLSSTECCTLS